MHQLYNGQTTELVVLKELIWKMAGIEPLPSLSDAQVTAMAGGPILRIESIASATRGARLDPGDAVLKGPWRLGKALLDSSLALSLLIQVAQQRQACVFKAPDTHLKSLASLYDTVCVSYFVCLSSGSFLLNADPRCPTPIFRPFDIPFSDTFVRVCQQSPSVSWGSWCSLWHLCTNMYANHPACPPGISPGLLVSFTTQQGLINWGLLRNRHWPCKNRNVKRAKRLRSG